MTKMIDVSYVYISIIKIWKDKVYWCKENKWIDKVYERGDLLEPNLLLRSYQFRISVCLILSLCKYLLNVITQQCRLVKFSFSPFLPDDQNFRLIQKKCYVYKKRNLIDVLRKKGMKWFPIFGTIRYAADVRAYISNAFTYRLRMILKSNQKYWIYYYTCIMYMS